MNGVFGILKIVMANKVKKKRNKQYRGVDAAMTKPAVTRISAANRSKFGQWWFERKRVLKPVLITAAIIIAVVWLIIELIRIANQ
jgi:hypothetical protein